jgi:hypothetical protein
VGDTGKARVCGTQCNAYISYQHAHFCNYGQGPTGSHPLAEMGDQAASSGLFSIFLIAIYTLFLVPYTFYKLCSSSDAEQAAQPWQKVSKSCRSEAISVSCRTSSCASPCGATGKEEGWFLSAGPTCNKQRCRIGARCPPDLLRLAVSEF